MIADKIKDHFENKEYVKITRAVSKNATEASRGYIVDYSDDLLILHETDDFRALGYIILPISHIEKLLFSKWEKYYNKIMIWEGEIENINIKHKIDLSNWQSAFKSLITLKFNVIVSNEDPDVDSFIIGPIVKMTKKAVYIQSFDPSGLLDEKPTSIDFETITKVQFNDRYVDIFSKYLRHRKKK